MTRSHYRFVGACVAVVLAASGAFAQVRSADPPPDYQTLKRLADQLGAGQGQIDPEMLKFAQEFMKNNPDFLKDPRVQQQMAEMQQKFRQDPNFAENMKRQTGLTPERLHELGRQFQGQGGGGMTNPNATGQPSVGPQALPQPPQLPPNPGQGQGQGQGTNPNAGEVTPPSVTTPQGGATALPQGNGGNGFENPGAGQLPGVGNGPPADAAKQLAQQNQEFGQLVGTWEANFGSLDNTPALKQAFIDMYSGGGGNWGGPNGGGSKPFDWQGNGSGGGSGNWGGGNSGGGSGLAQWFNNATSNGGPSWWKSMTGGSSGKSWFSGWNTGGGGGGASSYSPPSASGGGGIGSVGGLGGGFAGLGTAGMVIVGLIAAAVIAFLVYRYWPAIAAMRRPPTPLPGAGPWPIDPRDVKDRESLVRAFEYLSVFICGDGARVWNHVTIAEAFRENVPGAANLADPLARLYAVARYTPAREEIAPADIAEARRHLCRLAGVSEV